MNKKKIMCAALISVMALSLAACENKKIDYGMGKTMMQVMQEVLRDSWIYPMTAMLLLT